MTTYKADVPSALDSYGISYRKVGDVFRVYCGKDEFPHLLLDSLLRSDHEADWGPVTISQVGFPSHTYWCWTIRPRQKAL